MITGTAVIATANNRFMNILLRVLLRYEKKVASKPKTGLDGIVGAPLL